VLLHQAEDALGVDGLASGGSPLALEERVRAEALTAPGGMAVPGCEPAPARLPAPPPA